MYMYSDEVTEMRMMGEGRGAEEGRERNEDTVVMEVEGYVIREWWRHAYSNERDEDSEGQRL